MTQPLTRRQTEIVELLMGGWSWPQIASRLGMRLGGVKSAFVRIFDKTGMNSSLELVVWVMEHPELTR